MMMVVIERTLFERRLTGKNNGFREAETVLYGGGAVLDRDKVPEIQRATTQWILDGNSLGAEGVLSRE